MSHVLGIALALTVGWNGTNGFNPSDLLLVPAGTDYDVDSSASFDTWFKSDEANNADLVRYVVRCALPREKTVKYGRWVFPGEFGLAEPLRRSGLPGDKRLRVLWDVTDADRDAGKWISACVLALANMRSYHQIISIRGNPSNEAARAVLTQTNEERWTMGHPEGVFFGNLFNPAQPAGADLRSFSFSMNLPEDYVSATAGWWPPNDALGRTLDFHHETRVPQPGSGSVRIAATLATYERASFAFRKAANPLDPDYPFDAVCLDRLNRPASCPPGTLEILRPLFVHLPRLANLESPEAAIPTVPFQVISRGSPIKREQKSACAPDACIGPFPYLKANGAVGHPSQPGKGGKLVGLTSGQILEPTLRFIPGEEANDVHGPATGKPFTAVIRYSCAQKGGCRTVVKLQQGASVAGERWPETGCSDCYRWLQVHPVYLGKDGKVPALQIRLEGTGGPAPDLDAVGFVPGPPRCPGNPPSAAGAPFMGICPDS